MHGPELLQKMTQTSSTKIGQFHGSARHHTRAAGLQQFEAKAEIALRASLGYLSTKGRDRIISGAQFCSTMFENRAPTDHVSISCYVGGSRNPELARLPEQDLVAAVSRELAALLGIKGSPVITRTHRWPRGLPSYTMGQAKRRAIFETTDQRFPGLFLTENYIQGVSIGNCLDTANATALKILHSGITATQNIKALPDKMRR